MSLDVAQSSAASVANGRLRSGVRTDAVLVDALLAAGVALALGAIQIGTPSLWVDEAFTAESVREHHLSPLDQYHWLYYLALTPWSWIAGTSETALRFPSVVAAAVACALLVILGRALVGRWAALAAGLLLASSPFVVKWSQQARSYSAVLAVGILATLLLVRALHRGTRGGWALYGLGFSLLFALQPVSALVLAPAHGVLLFQRRRGLLPHGLVAACVIVVLGVPWVYARAKQTPGDNWLHRPSPKVAADTLLDVSGAAGIGLVLALVGIVVLWRARDREVGAFLVSWAFAPFALALVVSLVKPIYLDRYLITAAPGFALLGGVAIAGTARRLGATVAAAALVATSVGLVLWYSSGSNGNWRGEGWRQAVRAVERRQGAAAPVVVVPWWSSPAASYYGAHAEGTSTASSIWVIDWSETGHRLMRADRAPLGFGEHRLVQEIPFGRRLSLQHWVRSG